MDKNMGIRVTGVDKYNYLAILPLYIIYEHKVPSDIGVWKIKNIK